jgi:hypothetical protein
MKKKKKKKKNIFVVFVSTFFKKLYNIINIMSPELIGLVAIIGTTLTGILTTLFSSRCSRIRCGCIECDREVQHTKDDLEYEKAKKKFEESKKKFEEVNNNFQEENNPEVERNHY